MRGRRKEKRRERGKERSVSCRLFDKDETRATTLRSRRERKGGDAQPAPTRSTAPACVGLTRMVHTRLLSRRSSVLLRWPLACCELDDEDEGDRGWRRARAGA